MTDYPQPDPAWPYYAKYQHICNAHAKLTQLLGYFALPECETSTQEADEFISRALLEVQALVASAQYTPPGRGGRSHLPQG